MKTINRVFLCLIYGLLISLTAACKLDGETASMMMQASNQDQKIVDDKEKSIKEDKQEITPVDYSVFKQDYIQQYGEPNIVFKNQGEAGLTVKITTKRLVITSVTEQDIAEYAEYLYGDQKVMEKFATGQTKDQAYTRTRIDGWVKRWKSGIPFTGLTIRTKEGDFIGHVVLGGGDEPYCSETAYMLKADQWNQGYGYEAVGASILFYGAQLKEQGYHLPNKELFQYVIATTRQDNIASARIQQKIGMSLYKSTEKFGNLRDHYQVPIDEFILKNISL